MEHYDVAVVGLGALGSAATYHLARRGARVVAFEQFELGHGNGASHDTSRIVRTSYGAERYVRLAQSAYRDWADLEHAAGEPLLTITGGVIMLPTAGPYRSRDFTTSLSAAGVPHELLEPGEVMARWPRLHVPDGVETVYTADTGIAHAARTVATLHRLAREAGAELRERTPVVRIEPGGGQGVVVRLEGERVRAGRLVLATDAWTNELLEPLGVTIPLETMQEQVTYFQPGDPAAFAPGLFPVWIWEDEQCFYGFPTYGDSTIKAARDVSNNFMAPRERTFESSQALIEELTGFVHARFPDAGPPMRTLTCQYALTPDREFALGPLAEHPDVLVALAAGHGFKFTPAIGRILAELALEGGTDDDISAFVPPVTARGEARA